MIAVSQPSLLGRWWRQMGQAARREALPRPGAALGFLSHGPAPHGLIEVHNVILVVLYDELHDDGRLTINVAGFSGIPVPWGIQWGGAQQNLFLKNLLLRPRPAARGRCLNAARPQLLGLALQLDQGLDRFCRDPQRHAGVPWVTPPLWAGLRPQQAAELTLDGPELVAAAEQSGLSPQTLLQQSQLPYEGLVLTPLEWVSHHWRQLAAIFADLQAVQPMQAFPLHEPEADLQGFRGAMQFDFFHTRFGATADVAAAPAEALAAV